LFFLFYRYVVTTFILRIGFPGWPPIDILWMPVVIVIALFSILGVTFFLAAANVFREDTKFIAQTVLGLGVFFMPIMWFAESLSYQQSIPARLRHPLTVLCNANPFSWVVSAF